MKHQLLIDIDAEEEFAVQQLTAAQKSYNDWGRKVSEIRTRRSVVISLLETHDITPKKKDGDSNPSNPAVHEAPPVG